MKTYKNFINEQVQDIEWDNLSPYDRTKTSEENQILLNDFRVKIIKTEFGENDLTFADRVFTFNELVNTYKSFEKYYGYYDKALFELRDHLEGADYVYNKGGDLYRLIYANSEEDINKEDLGSHWTLYEWVLGDLEDRGWQEMYGEGKEKPFIIRIKTPPHNISIEHVDIHGNPEEKEVNIIDKTKIELVSIKEK